MTAPCLTQESLDYLERCCEIASESFRFYERLYDETEDCPDREVIGRAMAQKHDFIKAVSVIFKNHDYQPVALAPLNDRSVSLHSVQKSHFEQENAFLAALQQCLLSIEDERISELIEDHYGAAQIALKAIKGSSLKI